MVMVRLDGSVGSPWGSAFGGLAEAITQAPINRAKVRQMELEAANIEADNKRAEAQLAVQQAQNQRAAEEALFERSIKKAQEDRAAQTHTLQYEFDQKNNPLKLGKSQAELDQSNMANSQEEARIAGQDELAAAVTDGSMGRIESKMPQFDLQPFLHLGSALPPPMDFGAYSGPSNVAEGGLVDAINAPQVKSYMDTGPGVAGTGGMDLIGEREQFRNDTRDQIRTAADTAVLDKSFKASDFMDDAVKSYAPGGASGYRPATPEELAAYNLPPKSPAMVDNEGKLSMVSGAAKPQPQFSNIPAGYQVVTDPTTNALRMEAIPGGPADVKQQAINDKSSAQGQARDAQADIATQDIDRAIGIIDNQSWMAPATGPMSEYVKDYMPFENNAADLHALLTTIGGGVAIEQLAQMRQNSPTGAAMGAVSDKDMEILKGLQGSVAQSQSADQLKANLNRLWNKYQEVIHGPGNFTPRPVLGAAGGGTVPPGPSSAASTGGGRPPPEGVDPTLWAHMTPEQQALWP